MAAAAAFSRLSVNLVHFFLILLLTAELTSQRKDVQSKDLLNGVSGIQTGQELCKSVISVYKISKTKRSSMMSSTNAEKFRRIVGLTRKLILVNALLLCNDVALNPGPPKICCAGCFKLVKKNQVLASCKECYANFHLKCIGAEFEHNKTCRLCSIPQFSQNSQDFQDDETIFTRDLKNVDSLRGLKCVHQNIRNLSNKLDEIRCIVNTLNSGIHLISFTETWLNNSVLDEEVSIPGYTIFRKDRGSKGGGVIVYARDDLTVIRRSDLERPDIEGLWLEITLPKSRSFLFGTFYRPPSSLKHTNPNFMSAFSDTIEALSVENKEVLLLSDFNCDFSAKKTTQPECKQMKCLFKSLSFSQLINSPTRITTESSTLIDLIATNNPQNIRSSGVLSSGLSDHELIYCVRKLNWMRLPYEMIKREIRQREFLLNKARRSNLDEDWSAYRRSRNRVTKLVRDSKSNIVENSLIKTVTILKSFGKPLSRSCLAKKQSVLPILMLMESKFTMTRKLQTALINSSLKLWTDSFKFLDDVYHLQDRSNF